MKKGLMMAKDDYFVITYKFLSYLYTCLKQGKKVEKEYLLHDGVLFNINYSYWLYIVENLVNEGYIEHISNVTAGGGYYVKGQLEGCRITPKGIGYITDNSTFKRVQKFLSDMKDMIPFA